jgi:glucokinase
VLTRSPVAPRSIVVAIAGPVNGDEIPLTNAPWVIRPRGMFATFPSGLVIY